MNLNQQPDIKKRVKLLVILAEALHINGLHERIKNIAIMIDANHPKALETLNFYEENIISIMYGDVLINVPELLRFDNQLN